MNYGEILQSLKEGYAYSDGFRGFYLSRSSVNGKPIIRWNNYGSSAVKAKLAQLKWLIETIFDGDISWLKKGKGLFVYA